MSFCSFVYFSFCERYASFFTRTDRDDNATCICVDSSHNVCRLVQWKYTCAIIPDGAGSGFPLCFALTSTESIASGRVLMCLINTAYRLFVLGVDPQGMPVPDFDAAVYQVDLPAGPKPEKGATVRARLATGASSPAPAPSSAA